jgi:hypothetical protein
MTAPTTPDASTRTPRAAFRAWKRVPAGRWRGKWVLVAVGATEREASDRLHDALTDPRDFPDGWLRYRIVESDQFPGTRASRMRRAIKCLGRSFGIRVEGFADERPDGSLADVEAQEPG